MVSRSTKGFRKVLSLWRGQPVRRATLFVMLLSIILPLAQMVYHPKAKAAALTIASSANETQETTTSATYTATNTSIASGSLPAGTYLVTWGAAVANSNNAEITSVRLVRGTTEIAQLGSEANAATAANVGRTASGYWLGSLSGSEALTIEYNTSLATTTTAYIDSKFIKAIRLDTNLVADQDYYTSGSQESSTDEATDASIGEWVNVKSLTKTFDANTSQNYLVFASMEFSVDSATNDCAARLMVDGTAVSSLVTEGEDIADIYGYVVADQISIGSGLKTLRLEGTSDSGGATCDFRRSRIYVFRSNIFSQVLENESTAESTLASATWTTKVTQAYTPAQTEDIMVLYSWMGGSSAATSPIGTRIENSTDTVFYADADSHAVNNTTDYYTNMSAASLNVAGAKTFNGQYQRTAGTGTVKIKEAHLIVWSMTVLPPTFNQSAYRWYNNTPTQGTDWYNASWSARRKITFNNTASSTALTDFPVRVSLNSSNVDYAKTQNSGQDIRFTDSDGITLLKYEIEKWDELGTSEVWVKVPQIDSASSTDCIYMYYGNGTATDAQDAVNVWNTNYQGVWHLNKTSSTEPDSTSYATSGTAGASAQRGQVGKIGEGYHFTNAAASYLNLGDPVDNHLDVMSGSFTWGSWVSIDADTLTGQNYMSKGGGSISQAGYQARTSAVAGASHLTRLSVGDGVTAVPFVTGLTASIGNFAYIVNVVDRTSNLLRQYYNGVEVGTADSISAIGSVNSTVALYLGGTAGGSSMCGCYVDEARVSNIALSPDWIKADYLTQANSFNTISGEDTGALGSLTGADSLSTSLNTAGQANFRLRVAVHIGQTNLWPTNGTFKLQAAPRSGTCDTSFVGETYADLSPSSGALRYLDNSGKTDGEAMPSISAPLHNSDVSVPQSYEEANNFTALSSTPPSQDAVWEFALNNNSMSWNSSYCLRVVYSSGTTLAGYTVIPEVANCSSPPLSSQMRHGKAHCSSANRRAFYW